MARRARSRPVTPPALRRRPSALVVFLVLGLLTLCAAVATGAYLVPSRSLADLCSATRPAETLRMALRQAHAAEWHARLALPALGAGLLLVAFSVSASLQARAQGSRRWMLVLPAAALLLAGLVAVSSSADRVPWRSLEPAIVAGKDAPASVPALVPPEAASSYRAGCTEAARARVRRAYFAHVAGGTAVLLLGILLLPQALRFRREPPSRRS